MTIPLLHDHKGVQSVQKLHPLASTEATANLSVALLVGGLGTRLRSAVGDLPKALAPVHNRPFITLLLEDLAEASIREAVLLTGYQADMVHRTLGDQHGDMQLVYSREESPLGTGGAVRNALNTLAGSTILLLNGDSHCRFDLNSFCEFHRRSAADLSLLLTYVSDASRFGKVECNYNGRVTRFAEKAQNAGRGWINAGIYLINRNLIEEIPAKRPVSLEREMFPAWMSRGAQLFGYRRGGRFIDIGTPESLAEAAEFFGEPGA